MKALILIILFSISNAFAVSIYDTKNEKFISQTQLNQQLPDNGQIVLGEYHYQELIQKAQGNIIESVVKAKGLESNFSVAWEFLNYPDQMKIADSFSKYKDDTINEANLLKVLFSESRNPSQNDPYLSFFKATKNLNGEVLGSNAPRTWKRVITKMGLSSLDPNLIPPLMELGSDHYEERFIEVMGDHVPANLIKNYYEAQCYTDSVMAWSMQELGQYELKFLIVGSFHTDYNDGVIKQLKWYSSLATTHIKIVDTTGMTKEEIKEQLLTPHSTYGTLADYLYLVD